MSFLNKLNTIAYKFNSSKNITNSFGNIKSLGLKLRKLLKNGKVQNGLIIVVAFLISMAIFSSNVLVLLSTICLTIFVKIIEKNSSRIKNMLKKIIGKRSWNSLIKFLDTYFIQINLKPITTNGINNDILASILGYLPKNEILRFGVGHLIQLLKSKNLKLELKSKNDELVHKGDKTRALSLKNVVEDKAYAYLFDKNVHSIKEVVSYLHTAVLTDHGSVYVCGHGLHRQLGFMENAVHNLVKMPIENINGKVVSISLGRHDTALLTDKGKVYVCGENKWGQHGLGGIQIRNDLEEVPLQNIQGKVLSVALGEFHMAVLTDEEKLYVCGSNSEGELGLVGRSDVLIEMPLVNVEGKVISINLGRRYTVVQINNGKVYVCGDNGKGQLGLGDNISRNTLVEMPLDNIKGSIVSVTVGRSHTAVLTDQGKVYVCGDNSWGQLGLGDNTSRNILVEMPLENIKEKVVNVSLINLHTVVLTEEGSVYVCGSNMNGQLGLGDNEARDRLVKMPLENIDGKVVKVAPSGEYSTSVLTDQGKVYICGDNCFGQLGLGDDKNRNSRNSLVEMPTEMIFKPEELALKNLSLALKASQAR